MMFPLVISLLRNYGRFLFFLFSLFAANQIQAKTIVDITGRSVEIPEKVERILLGEGRTFHAIALLEGDKPFSRIAGWQGDFRKLDAQSYDVYKAKFPEIDNIPLIGNTTPDSISSERVLTLAPDIAIFGLSGHGPSSDSELVALLEKMHIPVVFIDFRSHPLKNTIPSMRILGEALHREEQAQRFIHFYESNLKKVTERIQSIPEADRPSVFIELRASLNQDCCLTAGNGNMGDFIEIAGGINIAKPLLSTPLGQINLEKLLSADPDIYILTGTTKTGTTQLGVNLGALVTPEQARQSAELVLSRKGISQLTAVKNHHTHAVWHNYYSSPYNIIVIQLFAKWFYPQLFQDLDPQQTMDELYSEFLAIQPSGTYWVDDFYPEKTQ